MPVYGRHSLIVQLNLGIYGDGSRTTPLPAGYENPWMLKFLRLCKMAKYSQPSVSAGPTSGYWGANCILIFMLRTP